MAGATAAIVLATLAAAHGPSGPMRAVLSRPPTLARASLAAVRPEPVGVSGEAKVVAGPGPRAPKRAAAAAAPSGPAEVAAESQPRRHADTPRRVLVTLASDPPAQASHGNRPQTVAQPPSAASSPQCEAAETGRGRCGKHVDVSVGQRSDPACRVCERVAQTAYPPAPQGPPASAEAGGRQGGPRPAAGAAAPPSAEAPQGRGAGQAQGTRAGQRELSEEQIAIKADKIFVTDNALAAQGHVQVRTKEFTITADVVEVDRRAQVAHFRGNVVITGDNQQTRGQELWLDLDSGWWKIVGARTKVEPQFFTADVLEPLYARGEDAQQRPETGLITLHKGELTSCDLSQPHYCLKSRRVTIRPGDKVTLHRPALYLWGRRVFRYPFNVTLSLRREKQKIIPEIGRNEVEGRYLKFAIPYLMGAHNNGVARLHFTEKRGTGLGFDHLLEDRKQSLLLSLFDEPSEGAISVRATHTYVYGKTLRSDASMDYQRSSGWLYSTTTLSSDLTFRNTDADSDTTLGFQRSQTTSSYGSTRRSGISFYHNQRLGQRTSWNLRSAYTTSRFANQDASDQELTADFELRHQARSYDIRLQMNNRYDLDASRYTGDSRYYSLNRLPLVTITTDTRRLGGWRLFGRASTRMRLELGRFSQDPDNLNVYRAAFSTDIGGSTQRLDSHTTLRTAVRFRQSWFDDGSAQYYAAGTAELQHSIDSHWHTRLEYRRGSTHGYAPLRLDYGGRFDEVTWGLVRYSPDRSRLELTGGYDFINSRYRDLRLVAEVRPSDRLYWRIQTAYSIESARWWPLVVRMVGAGRDVYMELNTTYDIDKSRLTTVTASGDLRLGRWWRVEMLGSYSGWTRTIDQAQVRITRDLHCLIAQLTWSKWPRELFFNIGIKAFPSYVRPLGIGRTGAYMPSMPGAYY